MHERRTVDLVDPVRFDVLLQRLHDVLSRELCSSARSEAAQAEEEKEKARNFPLLPHPASRQSRSWHRQLWCGRRRLPHRRAGRPSGWVRALPLFFLWEPVIRLARRLAHQQKVGLGQVVLLMVTGHRLLEKRVRRDRWRGGKKNGQGRWERSWPLAPLA